MRGRPEGHNLYPLSLADVTCGKGYLCSPSVARELRTRLQWRAISALAFRGRELRTFLSWRVISALVFHGKGAVHSPSLAQELHTCPPLQVISAIAFSGEGAPRLSSLQNKLRACLQWRGS